MAEAVYAASRHAGGPSAQVIGVATAEYPTPAKRPLNARLASTRALRTFGLQLPDWNAGLQKSVQVLVAGLEDMSAAKPGG
jgi:dTDP-4-dehydrorhamnose reductase